MIAQMRKKRNSSIYPTKDTFSFENTYRITGFQRVRD